MDAEGRYTQAEVDALVTRRLQDQAEHDWSEKVDKRLDAYEKSQVDMADTMRDIHAVMKSLLAWQNERMEMDKRFRLHELTDDMQGTFVEMARTWVGLRRWWKVAVGVWAAVVTLVTPAVTQLLSNLAGGHR